MSKKELDLSYLEPLKEAAEAQVKKTQPLLDRMDNFILRMSTRMSEDNQ